MVQVLLIKLAGIFNTLEHVELKKLEDYFDPVCNVVIETGTWHGNTTAMFAQHFATVHTIELCPELYKRARERFHNCSGITTWLGDSGTVLPVVLESLPDDSKTLVYLDAHYSGGDTTRGSLGSPIRAELEALVKYRHKVQQVIIDDVQVCHAMSMGQANEMAYHEGWPDWAELCNSLHRIFEEPKLILDKKIHMYWVLFVNR